MLPGWVQGNSNGPLIPMVESEIVLRGWLIERRIFIITISAFYLVKKGTCFA